jgi:hypothetical protein
MVLDFVLFNLNRARLYSSYSTAPVKIYTKELTISGCNVF